MDDKSWIKLYRKILTKGMLRDHAAYIVWSYILLKNRDGKVIVSRYTTSKELRMNPSTFKSALKRLEKKWQSVTTSVTNDHTLVQVVHWAQYQSDQNPVTTSVTTQSPPSHHPVTTINKNRELRIENIPPLTPPKGGDSPKKNGQSSLEEVWSFYLESAKTQEQLTPARREKIGRRLKTFTPEKLHLAIQNCFADRFYSGDNDRGWRANADYLFRNDEIVDKLLNLKPREKGVSFKL